MVLSGISQKTAFPFPNALMEVPGMGRSPGGTLTHSRVLAVIHNPSYAGAYVYGRYRDNKTVDADGHFEHHPVRLPDKNDWKVFLPDHHPAYIT